jgi:hypothetical protein
MKTTLRIAAVMAALAVASVAHAAPSTFDYSYTFGSGDVVSGSFTGTASGNLVTNLSNITASFDGTPLRGNGSLFNASYDPSTGTWTADAGVASFDGTKNDFLFIDSHYPIDFQFTNYFYSISAVNTVIFTGPHNAADNSVIASSWKLTSAVPETDNAALMLAGLGLLGLSLRRRIAAR